MILLGSRCFPLYQCLLICLLLGSLSTENIKATVGTNVILPCHYDAKYYGRLSVCWGRGAIPNSGCANEVISSDGTSVISTLSNRYILMGNLGQGDVSLTIMQVEESDSGMYGCRVHIPGWFNDQKHHNTLTVVAASPNPLKLEIREVKERTVSVRWSPVFDGGRPIKSYRIEIKNKQTSWDTAVTTEFSSPDRAQVLIDLRPARTYNLRIFAINSVGMSGSSNVLTVTTKEAAPEGPPLDMQLEALTPYSIKVTWKPPRADLRNGVLRSYSISYRENDPVGRVWQHQSISATRELESIVLTNLKPSTMYEVFIQAKTNAGIGPSSRASLCSTLAHITSTAQTITSTSPAATEWIQDTSFTASPIKTTSPAATEWIQETSFTTVRTTSTPETVTASTVWEQSAIIIFSVPPDPPLLELKEVTNNTISIIWIPGSEGDSPITGYYLEYKAEHASWDYTKRVVDFSPNQTKATIIEITPSTYNLRMFAKNSLGTSKASNVLTITTGEAGHQMVNHATTAPADTNATANVKEDHSHHLAAIMVPLALVVLTIVMATIWKLQRMKKTQGSLSTWMTNRAVRYRGADSLQEL
ncbi:Down syndrome cell adhesion molecule -like protein Precursor [Channa argus]|uniref:Down syndrome cell adhesion molecule-like protein n=1 Tax=Channa argus TaxID=215402 RepID=A0A6G1PU81_CHAAH|nr:Down syndrome cell adhesion molecule -like protein Precursor [Channa argus]